MVYISEGYNKVITEYFDITDSLTRKSLLVVNENEQNQVLVNLTSKLYDAIVSRVDDIDFGDIPNTKGDITKLPNFDKLTDSIRTMGDILVEYKQNPEPVDVIKTALNNIISRKDAFELAFRVGAELPMVLYNTICLSIISSISLMISTCIEFIKTPGEGDFEVSLNKVSLAKTKENLLFNNLRKFNKSCASGEMDKVIAHITKNDGKNMVGDPFTIMTAVILIGVALTIIPMLRELIYFFYYSRVRVSDYFDIQADLLQMNIYNLEKSEKVDKKEKEKIVSKQTKIMTLFRNIANKIAISNKESDNKATKDIVDSNKKYNITDVVDTLPDGATSAPTSASVLF